MDTDPANPGAKEPDSAREAVELRSFSDANAAEIAKASLLARGVECWLTADDCGGMYAGMDAVQGVKLFAHQSDREAALALLNEEFAGDDSPGSDVAPGAAATTPRIKLSFPQVIAGVVTGILLCLLYQWTSSFGTKTYRYDWNGDGRPDEVWIYTNSSL